MKNGEGFFSRLVSGLSKTRDTITSRVEQLLKITSTIDEELYEELEEILITSDIGVKSTQVIIGKLRDLVKEQGIKDPGKVKDALRDILVDMLKGDEGENRPAEFPLIITIVGVNGVGKTTSIGKLASKYKSRGMKVLLAAGDTFRAAAIDQLAVWANRAGVELVKQQEGSDPAAVIYDAIQAARSRKTDVLICDTAGRLHNKKNLMEELKKINRVIDREFSEARRETLLVLDATTGQNAVNQAREFMEVCRIDGIILTKIDGTAKGGIVIAINEELRIPVRYVGVGETIEDLQEFDADYFINALFTDVK
jgi:fused signal recognition particle receptor